MSEVFTNKVAESGILTIDLESYFPKEEIVVFDIKDYLFMGLILKEKDFRAALKELSLDKFEYKIVAVTCSADAIIPRWAYMLIAALLQPVCINVMFGTADEIERKLLLQNIQQIDTSAYMDNRVVVKGCGEKSIPEEAYLEITNKLRPVAKSIMFGEPCSTVPVYKKPKD